MHGEPVPVYSGEAQLHERRPGYVGFAIDDSADEHPFSGARGGSDYGTRYMLAVIEIDDNEQPVDPKMRALFKKTGKRTEKLAKDRDMPMGAALLCKRPEFQQWVHKKLQAMPAGEKKEFILATRIPKYLVDMGIEELTRETAAAEDWAKYYVYHRCSISSRAALANRNSEAARKKFRDMKTAFELWAGAL